MTISMEQKKFLNEYLELRVEKKALKSTGVAYHAVRKWYGTDLIFRKEYTAVRQYILNTKRCVYCLKVGSKDQFRSESGTRASWKTGICLTCDSKRVMKNGRKTIESKLKSLWKSTRVLRRPGGRADVRGDLSYDQVVNIWKQQSGLCYYTRQPMEHDAVNRGKNISIDRKDPDVGYVVNNIVLCLWEVNRMKSNLEYEAFLSICRTISSVHP